MTASYLNELQPSARLLLGPGPSSVHPRVLQAMTIPVIGHLDPDFFQVMNDIGDMLREVYHTSNVMTMPVSATGTGAMETACANILEPGDTMVVCRNGYFGIRLGNIAERCGARVYEVDSPWGQPVDPQALDDELSKHPRVKAVGVVHAETSTGVLTPLPDVLEVIRRHNALSIVDAVTSLGGHDMRVDEWGIDVCYSGTQKCLGAPPGLAPITLSENAMQVVKTRETPVQSFYFNLQDLESYWGQSRSYHHTAPISMTYALREALRMMMEEGIENRISRHARVAAALRAGLEALGLELLADPDYRLNPLTTVRHPRRHRRRHGARLTAARLRHRNRRRLGEFRGKAWRIGLMGDSARDRNVLRPAIGAGNDPQRQRLRSSLRLQPGVSPKGPRRLCRRVAVAGASE